MNSENCPLCQNHTELIYWKNQDKNYFECDLCHLVFLEKKYLPSINEEKKQYDYHQNSIENQGYVDFLNQLVQPLSKMIPHDSYGLDLGCGPGPTLSQMMNHLENKVQVYDPIYFPDESVFLKKYDFITATEVLEHVFWTNQWVTQCHRLLKENGILGVMTQELVSKKEFPNWWYHRDPTHTRFFSMNSFQWISKKFDFELIHPTQGVFILKKLG